MQNTDTAPERRPNGMGRIFSVLSRQYRLKRLSADDHLQVWRAKKRGLFSGEPFFIAVTDLFYLPENEHRIKTSLAQTDFPMPRRWQTPKVLVICSYNGMQDLSRDDLCSFTDRALIAYLLLERESGEWIGPDSFYPGGPQTPLRIRMLLQTLTQEDDLA